MIYTHTRTQTTHTEPQVIFILAHGRWESKNNNQVWLHILFSQTSSKLSSSPSCRVLWASSNSQHQSHFIRPARLSPPLFPGKCLTYSPQTPSKLKGGLSVYMLWYPVIDCATHLVMIGETYRSCRRLASLNAAIKAPHSKAELYLWLFYYFTAEEPQMMLLLLYLNMAFCNYQTDSQCKEFVTVNFKMWGHHKSVLLPYGATRYSHIIL